MASKTGRSNLVYQRMLAARRQAVAAALSARGEAPATVPDEDQPQFLQHEAVSVGLNSLGYTQLRLIQEALDRLAAGDYGVCLECEQPIPRRRLDAVPWARYCVPCQERADRSGSFLPHPLHDDCGAVA